MAFKDMDQLLIDECCRDEIDVARIQALIAGGADVNAFDEEHKQCAYEDVLDHYIFEGRERPLDLLNFYQITEIFAENHLILNQIPEDSDYCVLNRFRFLPPEKVCVDSFLTLLKHGKILFEDLEIVISDATLDLHLGEYYFFEQTNYYSREDSINYFLELIYWSCAYSVKVYPEKCSKELLDFDWFDREKNKVELIRENRSTLVFVEDLETHNRAEIDGWTMNF